MGRLPKVCGEKREKCHFLKRMDISKKRPLFCLVNIAHFSIIRKGPFSFWYEKKDKEGYYYMSWRLVAMAFDKRAQKKVNLQVQQGTKNIIKTFPNNKSCLLRILHLAWKIVTQHIFTIWRQKFLNHCANSYNGNWLLVVNLLVRESKGNL